MTANLNYSYISAEDYLEGERISPIKHEYIRGEIYAMAGASKTHSIIAGNFSLFIYFGSIGINLSIDRDVLIRAKLDTITTIQNCSHTLIRNPAYKVQL